MKKYGLGFDNESIKESIINDYTGRNHNLRKFINFLNSQKSFSKIALDGNWGSGKTYFIKQLQYILDANNRQSLKNIENLSWINDLKVDCEVVYFDSWKYESENTDPIILLLSAIQKKSIIRKMSQNFMDVAGRLVQSATKGVVEQKDIENLLKNNDPIDEFKEELDKYLNKLPNKRLVIVIDELDRCKPTYAINLLERVQHCLVNDKLTFVFSTNLSELSNTVKQIYGLKFDGDSYLDRFFDYTLLLPEPDLKNYYDKVISPDNLDLFDIANEVAKYFNFTLRQLNHYFSRISLLEKRMNKLISLGIQVDNEYPKHYFLIKYFATFMIALKMSNSKDYNEFLKGIKADSIINFLKKNRSFNFEFNSIILNTKINAKSLKGEMDTNSLSLLKCEKVIGTIYTGLFNGNEDYQSFNYPVVPGMKIGFSNSEGNKIRDKNYLLDIVSLIGENIEY